MSTTLTLYAESGWISPWVFHVMTALAEKGLTYQLELVPLPIPPAAKAELVEHSLIGKVPVLHHGDLWLTESLAISEYLAETFRSPAYPRLFPEALDQRARARQLMSWLRTDLFALREARPTTSVFGKPTGTALAGPARAQADELLRIAGRLIGDGRPHLFATWSIADADLALALMRLIKNRDEVPAPIATYAETQWARPSLRAFLDRTA